MAPLGFSGRVNLDGFCEPGGTEGEKEGASKIVNQLIYKAH